MQSIMNIFYSRHIAIFIIVLVTIFFLFTGCQRKAVTPNTSKSQNTETTLDPTGNWYFNDGVYEITLMISNNNKYYYSDNAGSSSGRYKMEGNMLTLIEEGNMYTLPDGQKCFFHDSYIRIGNFELRRK